ncbi:MAG: LysR family transcriptional regulator [Eggerthellaceae bacterium]|nr:LysR family transcriptional regulator [Eggerthellaceae bacterium]
MLLDQRLNTFLEVSERGSFSAAGKVLYLSAVSVMKHVESLESELGVKLFERSNRGAAPTEAGLALAEDVRRIARLADAAAAHAREVAGASSPTIRVGTSPLRPCKPLVDIWTRVGAGLPFDVHIVPFEDGRLSGPDPLDGQVDCFVGPCDAPSWRETCDILELGRYRCQIGVPTSHPLVSRTSLTWNDLQGEKLMLVREGASPVVDAIRADALTHPGVNIVDAPSFYTLDTFNTCAAEGLFLETLDAWEGVHPGIATLPMEWDYAVPYGIVCGKEPAPHVASFVDAIVQSAPRLSNTVA